MFCVLVYFILREFQDHPKAYLEAQIVVIQYFNPFEPNLNVFGIVLEVATMQNVRSSTE